MSEASFQPSRLFVEESVADLPLTRKIVSRFPKIPVERVKDRRSLKQPAEMTWAKKGLLLAQFKSDPVKEFSAMSQSAGKPYYSLDLISNCHLECTYCILQSYLANNPVITVFTNIEDILGRLSLQLGRLPEGSLIGTGKIADSLALDPISEHTKSLVPFFAKQDRVRLELKTKSACVGNLLGLDHGERTIVSWSVNPQCIIDREEYKTASLDERLNAAKRVSDAGYPVAFHFDPVIVHDGWKKNYAEALDQIARSIPPDRIAWMSVGALRYPARQARLMKQRFPKNEAIHQELISTSLRYWHYPNDLREDIYGWIEAAVSLYLEESRFYRCME